MDETHLLEKYGENIVLIGKGGFGKVFQVNVKGKILAVKIIETQNEETYNNSLKELLNLSLVSGHKNIMSYENHFTRTLNLGNGRLLYQIEIEMEYASTSLSKLIKDAPNNQINYEFLLNVFIKIASALVFAHKRKCAHMDLKPDNILFVETVPKIADWGGSLKMKSGDSTQMQSKELTYTNGFAAPEILDDESEADKMNLYQCDVYSFGILGLNACGISISRIKKIPLDLEFHDIIIDKLVNDVRKLYPNMFCDLLKRMCKGDPNSRIKIEDVAEILKKIKE